MLSGKQENWASRTSDALDSPEGQTRMILSKSLRKIHEPLHGGLTEN